MVKQYKPKRFSSKKKYKNPKLISGRAKGYDSNWEKYRFRFLHHNSKCYICGLESKVVDHLKAHKGDMELFECLQNHIGMCTICHNTVTGKFDRHNPPKTDEKISWIIEQRRFYGITVKVKLLPNYK